MPVWTRTWVTKAQKCANAFSQTWHWYGFSPVWMLMCWVKAPCCVNALAQTLHLNGFSPVCVRRWTVKCCAVKHALLQVPHMYGVTSMWVLECVFKLPCCVNALSHSLHLNGFSPVWIRVCLAKSLALAKSLSQTSQTCVLLPPDPLRWPRSLLLGTAKQIVVFISSSSPARSRSKLSANICTVLLRTFLTGALFVVMRYLRFLLTRLHLSDCAFVVTRARKDIFLCLLVLLQLLMGGSSEKISFSKQR